VLVAVAMTWVVVSRVQSAGEDEPPVDTETLRRVWGQRNDVDAEIRRLHSEYPLARARAAARLADLTPTAPGNPRITDKAVPDLIALLGDDTELQATEVHPNRAALHPTTPGGEAGVALRRIGPAAADALLEVMRTSQGAHARGNAAHALGGSKDPRAVEALIAALEEPDAEVRAAAAESLGALKDARAVEPLIGALQDEDASTRANAAWALGQLRDARAVQPLIALLQDVDQYARDRAVNALGDIRDLRAVEPLIRAMLNDESGNVRLHAAHYLGCMKDERAIEPLIQVLQDTEERPLIRSRAAWALSFMQDPAAEPALVDALCGCHLLHEAREQEGACGRAH
jgi:HEAT repeat protein